MNRLFILPFLFFLLLLFSQLTLNGQESSYTGIITDAHTSEHLVFVSISRNQQDGGTTTNLDGHFSLPADEGDTLYFSYVGYAEQRIILGREHDLHVQLFPQTATLEEIIVRPGENPAWRIIREVMAHKKENDPQNYEGYSYNAYHKTVMSMDSLSSDETWEPIKEPNKEKAKKAIAKAKRIRQLFNKDMHFWVTESFTKTLFRRPAQHKEEIVAYESSMPNDFTGGLNPINFQPFGFYQELIRMEFTDQNYVNPISKSCFQHYDFQLKDTLFHSIDTTFVIAFKPIKGKNFVALEGLLYINTHGFAIEHVIASSADKNQTLQFELQQQSKLINGRWFPQQLNTDLYIEMGFQNRFIIYGFRNRSLITDINYEVPNSKMFNHYLRENNASSAIFPDSLRPLPLSKRELNTYSHWDSLPELQRTYRALKAYNGLIKIVATGLLETKTVDFVVTDLLRYNQYEGLRLGLGLQTSPQLFKNHTFYGYGAYGLKDQAWKYGGAWEIKLYPHRGLKLRGSYSKDIVGPGAFDFLSAINRPWSAFNSRDFVLSRLDAIEEWKIGLHYRPHPAWQLNVFTSKETRKPNYDYQFFDAEDQPWQTFNVNQIGLGIRWAPKEKLVKMDQLEAILYPSFPVIDLSASYGQFDELDLSFYKIAGRLEHEFRWKYLGTTAIALEAGYLNTPLPYPYLFQVAGNNSNGIASQFTFNTAGVTEFVNQEYVYAFITHDFGYLLGKSDKLPWFRPELSLTQNIGWGKNHASSIQHSLPLKDFSKTYLESGAGLKNILRLSYFKTMYIGLGGAAYYRWGAYHSLHFKDNLFMQFLLTISV